MQDATLDALRRISKPLTFPKGTLIFREGMPGLRMYIIIQGRVGVYIDTLLDERVKVEEMQSGEFFGEMSILDKMPRSATCIAMEDTLCVAISRGNLRDFIVQCPDLTEKLMLSISTRIRGLNDQLYKSPAQISPGRFEPFSVPAAHRPHTLQAPEASPKSLIPFQDTCPACGREITLRHIQTYTLSLVRVESSMRRIYRELDVLWHYLWSCPLCGYTNFSTNFHQLPEKAQAVLPHLVEEQRRYRENHYHSGSPFDDLAFQYYQAIHINVCLNGQDKLLQGKLWLYLHWLYSDAGDAQLTAFARDQALQAYEQAFDQGGRLLKTEDAQAQCAQVIAELYLEKQDFQQARSYYQEVMKCGKPVLTRKAQDRIYEMRELRKAAQG